MQSDYEEDSNAPSELESDVLQQVAQPIFTASRSQSLAANWANAVLQKQPQIRDVDRPYVHAVLTEAAFFERPLKELACAINIDDDTIVITLKGYKQLLNDRAWYKIFLSPERGDELKRVTNTFTQLTDDSGVIKVIHVARTVLQNSVRRSAVPARRKK